MFKHNSIMNIFFADFAPAYLFPNARILVGSALKNIIFQMSTVLQIYVCKFTTDDFQSAIGSSKVPLDANFQVVLMYFLLV